MLTHRGVIAAASKRIFSLAAIFALLASLLATSVAAAAGPIKLGLVHRNNANSTNTANSFAFGEDVYLTGSGFPIGTEYYRVVDLQTNQQLAWGQIMPSGDGQLTPELIWHNPSVAGDTYEVQVASTPFPWVGQYQGGANGVDLPGARSDTIAPTSLATADFYITPPGLDVPEVPTPAVYLLGLALIGGAVWWRRRREITSIGS